MTTKAARTRKRSRSDELRTMLQHRLYQLIQMKAETVKRIDTALRRLDEGTYGDCFECGNEIAGVRLRALPFALRCKDCEEMHEVAEQREAQRLHLSEQFFD